MSAIVKPFPPDLSRLAPQDARGADALFRGRLKGGRWPQQWLYPGPNSRWVNPHGSVATPDYNSTATVLEYIVPNGYRFSLRGVIIDGSSVSNWVQGSGDMVFNLNVIAAGTRVADWFQNIKTPLGSAIQGPYPVGGRLEFLSNDKLQWQVSTVQNVGVGDPNFVSCFLWGHIYPNTEADD